MKKRVVVAMSGGVDSCVAASLLVDEGYEVIGITMQVWPSDASSRTAGKSRGCCGVDAAMDAFSVANLLGIPHYVLDFQEVFRKQVIENFALEYAEGKTPNPCVRCNEFVKFKALFLKALSLDADYLATGHYAGISYNGKRSRYVLKKGSDIKKDQSYVLYPLKQEELSRTLFPLSTWTKDKVREYAKTRGLPTAQKKESYDICFVPNGDYASFVKKMSGEVPKGPVVNPRGEVLGEHQGLLHYTIGQRRGLGISAKSPLYVLDIQPATNTLVVGEESELFKTELLAFGVNWVSIPPPAQSIEALVRIRSHALEAKASITPLSGERVCITFCQPQKAVTPGQSVVFYEGDEVLGGGIIQK